MSGDELGSHARPYLWMYERVTHLHWIRLMSSNMMHIGVEGRRWIHFWPKRSVVYVRRFPCNCTFPSSWSISIWLSILALALRVVSIGFTDLSECLLKLWWAGMMISLFQWILTAGSKLRERLELLSRRRIRGCVEKALHATNFAGLLSARLAICLYSCFLSPRSAMFRESSESLVLLERPFASVAAQADYALFLLFFLFNLECDLLTLPTSQYLLRSSRLLGKERLHVFKIGVIFSL